MVLNGGDIHRSLGASGEQRSDQIGNGRGVGRRMLLKLHIGG